MSDVVKIQTVAKIALMLLLSVCGYVFHSIDSRLDGIAEKLECLKGQVVTIDKTLTVHCEKQSGQQITAYNVPEASKIDGKSGG